ncbi:MAG: SDR family oxidoreductase [Planctomycetota bacterium]
MDLSGKAALVTGAGRRLGREIALGLARAGMAVAVHYRRSRSEAEAVVAEIHGFAGTAVAVGLDLHEVDQVPGLIDRVTETLGRVHVLVNNASFFEPAGIATTDRGRFARELAVHVEAPFLLSQRLAARLGPEDEGRIVNLLDWRSLLPDADYLGYSVAKGALYSLTRNLALALAPRINVNAVAPGAILPAEGTTKIESAERLPAGRSGTARDVVSACLYLIRDADFVTGAVIPVDGGRHLL